MNTIHQMAIGDPNGNQTKAIESMNATTRLTNASSTSSTSTSTKINVNTSTDTDDPKEASYVASEDNIDDDIPDVDNQANNISPHASTSNTNCTTTPASKNLNVNGNSLHRDYTEDLKIIGHIRNIEKINEKRRIFLNNTISSEYTIDEKTEIETQTKSINGAKTVVSETRTHIREEEGHVGDSVAASCSSTDVGAAGKPKAAFSTNKYETLPKTPGSPPPKPPMLSRKHSIGIGEQRSHSASFVSVTSAASTTTTGSIGSAPLATPTPTTILTPTSPLATNGIIISNASVAPNATSTATLLPETSKAATVQLREETVPTLRRVVERPNSLSPEAPKQISVNHYERLIEELKCPGCAYPMKTPILLCKTGHSICQQCTRVLLLCPLCKEPFTNIRSLTVEALCSKAHFRCSNAAGGCTVRLQIDLLGWHEKQCIYKPMKCFMGRVWGDCDWTGREAHWKEHLENQHADKVFTTQTTNMIWDMGVKQKPLTGYYVFMVYDEMFNFYEVHDKERILFTMACTSTVKEKKHNYAFEVTIVHQDNEAIAITQKYPVHSEYDNDILAEGTCISMPLTDLAKFINEDRLLHYRVHIMEIRTPRKLRNSHRSNPHTGIHPTDFQQTQIEGVNLKSVPTDVILTRKLDDIPYADHSTDTTLKCGGAQTAEGVSETEGEIDKVENIYSGKFSSNESDSDSDPEFNAFIAKKWGTPQLHFNRKFLKHSSNESTLTDDVASVRKFDRRFIPDDKISVTSTSTSYKQRVTNSLRKSFRGLKAPLFTKKATDDIKESK